METSVFVLVEVVFVSAVGGGGVIGLVELIVGCFSTGCSATE
jgi:hypothetical protein